MAPMIDVPDDLYARLAELAQPFVETKPADVIRRLVESHGVDDRGASTPHQPIVPQRPLATRVPRERGAKVLIDETLITADSVRDLYEQVLRLLTKNGRLDRLKTLLPYKTSSRRYLIAERPVHPNGNPFVVPVEYRGLYMETHKSYQTALTQLGAFLSKCGLSLHYVG